MVTIISSDALAASLVFGQKTSGAVSAMLHTADPYTVKDMALTLCKATTHLTLF